MVINLEAGPLSPRQRIRMRVALALAACLEAVHGFAPSPAGIGPSFRPAGPSSCAVSGVRIGSPGLIGAKMTSAYDFQLPTVGGGSKSLADYKGKAILIQNVASL